jgi:hypothetical protein
MATYVLLFVGRTAQPDADDKVTADYNQQWQDYMGGLAQAGTLRGGAPLEPSGKTVGRDGVTDLEVKDVDIGGYVVVEADSVDEATEIAQGAPHIALGGTTIVRPCLAVG